MDIRHFSYINYGALDLRNIYAYTYEERDREWYVNGHRIYSEQVQMDLTRLLERYHVREWCTENSAEPDFDSPSFDLEVEFYDGESWNISRSADEIEVFPHFLHDLKDIFDPYVRMFSEEKGSKENGRYLQSVGCCISHNGRLFDYNLFESVNELFPNFHIMIISDTTEEYTGNIEHLDLSKVEELIHQYELVAKFGEEYEAHVPDIDEDDPLEDGILLDLCFSDGSLVQIVQDFSVMEIEDFTYDFISLMMEIVEENSDKLVRSSLFDEDFKLEDK